MSHHASADPLYFLGMTSGIAASLAGNPKVAGIDELDVFFAALHPFRVGPFGIRGPMQLATRNHHMRFFFKIDIGFTSLPDLCRMYHISIPSVPTCAAML